MCSASLLLGPASSSGQLCNGSPLEAGPSSPSFRLTVFTNKWRPARRQLRMHSKLSAFICFYLPVNWLRNRARFRRTPSRGRVGNSKQSSARGASRCSRNLSISSFVHRLSAFKCSLSCGSMLSTSPASCRRKRFRLRLIPCRGRSGNIEHNASSDGLDRYACRIKG